MATNGYARPLTAESFDREVLSSERPAVVDFWAGWCGPCLMIAPAIEELARELDGRALVGKVDVDAEPGLAERYGILSIPTILFFHRGELVARLVGAVPKEAIRERLEAILAAQD